VLLLCSEAGRNFHVLAQAKLLRDIFGPMPFHPLHVDQPRLTPSVVKLAKAIYHDRAFDRMPDLAIALTEAGCHNQEILDHCKGSGVHFKGCWLLDLIVGKA